MRDSFLPTILIFVFLLCASCGGGGSGGSGQENESPVASAGDDQIVEEQVIVNLTGKGTDSDGTIASYRWSQISGAAVPLNGADTDQAIYVAPTVKDSTVLGFRLTVTDDQGASASDEVVHMVIPVNEAPVANAGPDLFAAEQVQVNLDGSQSLDSDGSIVSYSWKQTGGPVVDLNNADTATPSFVSPDVTDLLTFELTVTDDEETEDRDTVKIGVAEVLFATDFDDGDQSMWTVVNDSGINSNWTVNAGEYYQTEYVEHRSSGNPFDQSYHRGTFSYLNIPESANWLNYRLSVEIIPLLDNLDNISEGNDIGMIFRYQDNNNYYRISFSSRYGFSRLEKKVSGAFSTLSVNSRGYFEEEKIKISVEVTGSLIQVFKDDEPLFSVIDSDVTQGTVALYCQDRVKFDNVLVTQNNPAPAIILSSPIAHSVITTDTIEVSAVATNVPPNGSVAFKLDDGQDIVDSTFPYSTPLTMSQGEHKVEAILQDESGFELARDTNEGIGVLGDYYVAVGDSITNGDYDNFQSDNISQDERIIASQGYEANLSDRLTASLLIPQIVYNEGLGGDTSQDANELRIDSILSRHERANKVLILLGTNDSRNGLTPAAEYEDNMQSLVDKVTLEGKEAWVALVPPAFEPDDPGAPDEVRNQQIEIYNNIITSQLIGMQLGPDLYDYFLGSGSNRSSLFHDHLHPNGLGYAVMAHLWHNVLNPDNTIPLPSVVEDLQPIYYKQNLLEMGDNYYIDEAYTLTSFPPELDGGIWIMTSNDDREKTASNFLSFIIDFTATVYVAYDSNASSLPDWLLSFNDTGLEIQTTDPFTPTLQLFSMPVTSSPAPLIMGANHAGGGDGVSNYIAIVVPLENP
jgi:lysophospholipase L1-like esterase